MTAASVESPSKILLVRAGRGGDLVMITPAVKALLQAFPGAEFHLLTTGDGKRILGDFDPRITRTFVYTRRFPRTLLVQRRLNPELAAEDYDRIYVFETKPFYRKWLSRMAPQVEVLAGTAADGHYCARCLDLVAGSVAKPIDRPWVTLGAKAEGIEQARQLMAEHGVGKESRLVGLHPTFSGTGLPLFRDRKGLKHRMWPAESFARLARLLVEQNAGRERPVAVVIDALPDEVAFVQPIVEQSGGAVTLLAAPPNFQRYKGFLALLDVLVTPNTGPMHMAAALNRPLVALFSHWSPEDCGPFMDPARCRVLRAEDTTQPDLGLAALSPESVAAAVTALLD